MVDRVVISTTNAPGAIGPYSQAIKTGNIVFCSGQIGFVPATGELIGPDITVQTRQALLNVQAVLESAGISLADVVKTTVFLVDMADFAAMNEVYGSFFVSSPPARSTVAVAQLPRNARVEVECIAIDPRG
jgi:2-iminobutanoate/2-iminopropanoate deaminase